MLLLMMASNHSSSIPEFIGSSGSVMATGSSISPILPVGALSGDLIVSCVAVRGDRDVTASSGWTQQADVRSGATTTASRIKVFTFVYSGSPPPALIHSVSAAYTICTSVARGGSFHSVASNQSASAATTSVSIPGALLLGFGSINPRSTTGGNVPVASQPAWQLDATGSYVTSATLINYLVYAYHRDSSGAADSIVVGTDYGTESSRIGTVVIVAVK